MADVNEKVSSQTPPSPIDSPTIQENDTSDEAGFIQNIIAEIIYSPLNLILVALIAFLIYKIIKSRSDNGVRNVPAEPELPKLRKDFTVQDLKKFDGTQPDGRVLVAVNGHVYDVTKGKKFYGPGKLIWIDLLWAYEIIAVCVDVSIALDNFEHFDIILLRSGVY